MSKRSKIQMGIDKKKRQKERREGIRNNVRDKVHISKRHTYLPEAAIILSMLGDGKHG